MFTDADLHRADWHLLKSGPITLFKRKDLFEASISDLKQLGYLVLRVRFSTMDAFYRDVSACLKWREQFGYDQWNGNLDALNDGFRDQPFEAATESVFCIEDFHRLVAADRPLAHEVLDIIALQSRNYLLFGKRLVGLIQTSDEKFNTGPLGGAQANWNKDEWLNKNRGV